MGVRVGRGVRVGVSVGREIGGMVGKEGSVGISSHHPASGASVLVGELVTNATGCCHLLSFSTGLPASQAARIKIPHSRVSITIIGSCFQFRFTD